MFDKILIANRGEIACRIMATARRLGVAAVAVYSDADTGARHVRLADAARRIGPAPARDSYLRADALIEAALASGAQAVHPGYGFLSENAAFAEACERAGLVFIGPPAGAIRAMGSKSAAKSLMEKAGVPLTPGYHGDDQDPGLLAREAARIGYPVLIKASAGGGGKGMRRVDRAGDFDAALAACKREAAAAFGDDRMLIERYVQRPRHIEIQVFGDSHGNMVHLFERDCSVQRRHQKVLEEAPAPGMATGRREAMGRAAIDAARAVGYVGAGTVEFIVDPDGTFYFMEMNTRLQVEHPVTEMITGLDLVEWQLRVASGEALPPDLRPPAPRGHALEARLYAEDPGQGFLPAAGRLRHFAPPPAAPWLRLDAGVDEGDTITPHYDPMIAKLIVHGADRREALARMRQALSACRIVGPPTNLAFLSRLVATPSFDQADLDTGLIEREHDRLFAPDAAPPREAWLLAALAEMRHVAGAAPPGSPWRADGWRLNTDAATVFVFSCGGHRCEVSVTPGPGTMTAVLDGSAVSVGLRGEGPRLEAALPDRMLRAEVYRDGARRFVYGEGTAWTLTLVDPLLAWEQGADTGAALTAPMPGRMAAHLVAPGARVAAGTPLLVLEAMKMEHTIGAPTDGRVKAFRFAVGDSVNDGDELVDFEP
ncbi:MAG: acetyl/propionyl/methylcrotonyl-CoA carboxylase subunit alpha [Alcaligenaceae bacterium]|nr:acetyl/propionyl/methylcrotonyl-CoA carboxylase subunit alpha [Alcaligenaceae bacterium SAGV5]MPS53763.1 acetyl/propionyl/methylcrotonyl-CoA carboxylase subunit alpha [Alcaligenaceae bacterium SAGV3]MPT59925.1 acetyl/propionyl/methylcrotonyl-CoA carboxylase subunit alpha [Alcaligenaceae bacterium]